MSQTRQAGRPKGSEGNALVTASHRLVIEELLQMGHTTRDAAMLASQKLGQQITERKVKAIREDMLSAFDELLNTKRDEYLGKAIRADLAYASFLLKEYEESKKPLLEISMKGAKPSADMFDYLQEMKVKYTYDQPEEEAQSGIRQRVLFDIADQLTTTCTVTTREQKGNVTLLQEYRRVIEGVRKMLGFDELRFNNNEEAVEALRIIISEGARDGQRA